MERHDGLELSIRGAGYNIAGNALCDNGVTIDFSRMKNVRVDVREKRAYVEPGATLANLDEATQAHGLATPLGINSTTGIAGLTLGGGFGCLTRKYGMTIDNLISVDVVTADGKKIRASENDNPDLFWAIRVAAEIWRRYPVRIPTFPCGSGNRRWVDRFPFDQAKQVLTKYRQFVASAPEERNVWVVLRKAPPLPFLSESVHGKEIIALPIFYCGPW